MEASVSGKHFFDAYEYKEGDWKNGMYLKALMQASQDDVREAIKQAYQETNND